MKDVELGVITAPVGLRGEVRVKSYAEDPSRFNKVKSIELRRAVSGAPASNKAGKGIECEIEKSHTAGGMVVLKLKGIDDRDAAERLRLYEIFMDADDLEPLPEGEHYIRDLIGLDVISADTGEHLGTVGDILTDRPQDIYVVVKEDGSEFMIPSVPEFIREIDEKSGCIKVSLIEGMC